MPSVANSRRAAPANGGLNHEFDEDDAADQRADGCVLDEARLQFGEIDVKHHDDEEEQHCDRADVDDDEEERQKLGAQKNEQAGGVEEGQDQEQDRMDRVAGRDHHHGRDHAQDGE